MDSSPNLPHIEQHAKDDFDNFSVGPNIFALKPGTTVPPPEHETGSIAFTKNQSYRDGEAECKMKIFSSKLHAQTQQ
jgi:hypothetical protein